MSRLLLGLALLFGCAVLWTQPSAADGALAIALPSDVVKVGFAYVTGYNYPTAGEAQQKALENCKKTKSDVRKKLCAIINTFKNQCFAVAMDPADGTPGVGWAVEADLRSSEAEALAKCEATAGPGRRAACKVDISGCDGTAN
jgi:Domain of unknown function (DUF4189)